ncbi:MAG: hypothetical protein ACTHMM_04895 [Agriterribacter sp.]
MDSENKRKHLEFIQLTITRMNVNSFLVKGWLITLVAAIFVLAQKDSNTGFIWITPFATILFWMLDGLFISTERQFRSLYDKVRVLKDDEIDYSMDVSQFQAGRNSFLMCLISKTLLLFYPLVLVASILGGAMLNR